MRKYYYKFNPNAKELPEHLKSKQEIKEEKKKKKKEEGKKDSSSDEYWRRRKAIYMNLNDIIIGIISY